MDKIAFLGFGEAARAITAGWRESGLAGRIAAHDIKLADPDHALEIEQACRTLDVDHAATPDEALAGAGLVFSLVTADNAVSAATEAARHLMADAIFLDGNSCSPGAKQRSEQEIAAAGGRYVDTAIMSPIHPARHRTAMLLAGPHAASVAPELVRLGMNARVVGDKVGQASSIKMLRSVMIKGFEALTAECFLAARRAGVQEEVLASLQASDPGFDWARRAAYNLERMAVHGKRRAAEMREVVVTLSDLGLPDGMSRACVDWQQLVGDLELGPMPADLPAASDAVLSGLSGTANRGGGSD